MVVRAGSPQPDAPTGQLEDAAQPGLGQEPAIVDKKLPGMVLPGSLIRRGLRQSEPVPKVASVSAVVIEPVSAVSVLLQVT